MERVRSRGRGSPSGRLAGVGGGPPRFLLGEPGGGSGRRRNRQIPTCRSRAESERREAIRIVKMVNGPRTAPRRHG